jgi:phosphoglucomutase
MSEGGGFLAEARRIIRAGPICDECLGRAFGVFRDRFVKTVLHVGLKGIADVIIRMLLAKGVEVRYVFVAAVTKVVVYTRETADGFIYVSASHNPVGYNGVKLGLADGRTLPARESYEFISEYEAALADQDNIENVVASVNGVPADRVKTVFDDIGKWRGEATGVYNRFCDCVVTGAADPHRAQEKKATLREQIRAMDLWIGLDPNGGARRDKEYLENWGFNVAEINARPREDIVHELAPTPTASEAARKELLRLQDEGKKIVAFFVFDTDGDRRNIVVPDG